MSWPTGNGLSAGQISVRFLLPTDSWWAVTLLGQLQPLSMVPYWDAVGTVTPAIAALEFLLAIRTAAVQNVGTGQVVCFAADNMQYINQDPSQGASQWIKCDGQSLPVADFTDLFNVIGYTFGGSGPNFNVPDMRGRVVVDAGTGPGLSPRALGDTFGEETHTLSQGEMPSHNHTTGNSLTSTADIVPTEPVLVPNPLPAFTGNTGGGGAHNNLQPSLVLFYYIQWQP